MRLRDLILEFDARESLPVEVDDVVGYLRRHQLKDEVNFVGVDMNTEVLRGTIHHFVLPGLGYGEPTVCADIYYDRSQTNDWKRLVCCKELLHLLDPDITKVKSKQDFIRQVEKMVLPAEFQDPVNDGLKVMTDRLATYMAVAVLFPWSARALLVEPFANEKLTLEDVARISELPPRYAALVMSPSWTDAHAAITDIDY